MKSLFKTIWHSLPLNWRIRFRTFRVRILRGIGLLKGDWGKGVAHEVGFWRTALADNGKIWGTDLLKERLDPSTPLQAELCGLLPSSNDVVKILDVGAGPLTTVGKAWAGHTLEITAVDPLADEYDDILREHRISPPVRTKKAFAEKLTEVFPKNTFDLAYSSNALDHALDPILAFRQMLEVTKPGGVVYLWHFANEGENEAYSGLHQWNFNCVGDDMIIDNGKQSSSLRESLKGSASVEAKSITWRNSPVVIAIIHKNK